ncbi:PTS sugar transporter subunit IIA [Mycoplasma elephantis]|uniref:PTS sugar transporter subunit IIA n=1 Tax=Mycoplasma elephantis TaxID=114882 RepID=UPI000488972A|nr:PTS glucose transporter subunit IIA [Mycoplasma elephantis]
MWFSKKSLSIVSPCDGVVNDLKSLNDGVFSEKMLGDGVAIKTKKEKINIYAPCDSILETVFDTKHAYGISTKNTKILIHIGIDTVELKGKGFESFVKQGQTVKQGDHLCTVDINEISTHVSSSDIIILVLPESINKNIFDLKLGETKVNNEIFKVK